MSPAAAVAFVLLHVTRQSCPVSTTVLKYQISELRVNLCVLPVSILYEELRCIEFTVRNTADYRLPDGSKGLTCYDHNSWFTPAILCSIIIRTTRTRTHILRSIVVSTPVLYTRYAVHEEHPLSLC